MSQPTIWVFVGMFLGHIFTVLGDQPLMQRMLATANPREAKRAIEKAREGGGPTLIESVTLRMEGHAVHDDAFYVPKELFEEWARRDPIERFRTWLRDTGSMGDEEEEEITAGVKRLLHEAMQRADFSYDLPEELIAQAPLGERSASRLLVLDGASGAIAHRHFKDLEHLLAPGDLLVVNDTRVIPARLYGHKESGGRVELLMERPLDERRVLVQLRASKPPAAGQRLHLDGGTGAVVVERHADRGYHALESATNSGSTPIESVIGST